MYEPILHEEFSILNASELCKILGDYNRMRLLLLLSDTEERTISEIAAKLHSSASLVSHQIRLLKEVHILTTRKTGKYVYCKIADHFISVILQLLLLYTQKTLLQMLKAIPQKHYAFGVFLSLNYDVINRCSISRY